jgi:hypothetical protein
MAAAVVLVAAAVAARVAWELLRPLVPLLTVGIGLGVIGLVIFGGFRR